jgi:hypothetical protein
MKAINYCLSGAAGVLALGAMTLTAQAAPAGASTADLKTAATTSAEKVRYRRCWWHDGHRHCRYYREYGPSFSFYGPGFGLYLGDNDRGYRRHYYRDHHRRNKSQY